MNKLEDYLGHEFESSTYRTEEYVSFERKCRNYIKKHLPGGFNLNSFNGNHFCFSCDIESDNKNFIYMSVPDVRFFPDEWATNILIRSMKHEKDWTGGLNNYTTLTKMTDDITNINQRMNKQKQSNDEMS